MIDNYLQAVTIKNKIGAAHKDIAELEQNDLYCEACEYIEEHYNKAINEAYSRYWEILEPVEREYTMCLRCKATIGRKAKFCKMCGQRVRP